MRKRKQTLEGRPSSSKSGLNQTEAGEGALIAMDPGKRHDPGPSDHCKFSARLRCSGLLGLHGQDWPVSREVHVGISSAIRRGVP